MDEITSRMGQLQLEEPIDELVEMLSTMRLQDQARPYLIRIRGAEYTVYETMDYILGLASMVFIIEESYPESPSGSVHGIEIYDLSFQPPRRIDYEGLIDQRDVLVEFFFTDRPYDPSRMSWDQFLNEIWIGRSPTGRIGPPIWKDYTVILSWVGQVARAGLFQFNNRDFLSGALFVLEEGYQLDPIPHITAFRHTSPR